MDFCANQEGPDCRWSGRSFARAVKRGSLIAETFCEESTQDSHSDSAAEVFFEMDPPRVHPKSFTAGETFPKE